uniref:Uncharacterized protein n=1 Tax=Lepeophtheirus salmonis TaxID=72036 RepID=A0A0K2SX79_LEPSM
MHNKMLFIYEILRKGDSTEQSVLLYLFIGLTLYPFSSLRALNLADIQRVLVE